MSSEWSSIELSQLLAIKPRNGLYKGKEFQGKGQRWIKMKDIYGNDFIRNQSMERISVSEKEKLSFGCLPGDLLFGRTSLTLEGIGDCALVGDVSDTPIFESNLFRLRFAPDRAEPSYYYYFFKSPAGKFAIQSIAKQTAATSITATDLIALNVPHPALQEQGAIAELLQALDTHITLLRETNATLEAIAQALFKSWFVDFDPVRAKLEGRTPEGMDEATARLFPDSFEESELGLVPRGWPVETIGEHTNYLNRGISPKYIDEGGIVVINQKCIRDFSLDMSKARRHDPAQRKVDGRELLKGDILVNSTGVGTLGRVAQVLTLEKPTIVDSHVTVIRAGASLTWNYLGLLIMRRQSEIEGMGEGSTGQTELSRGKLAALKLLVPSAAVLHSFDEVVLPLRERFSENQTQAQTLATLRDTLLPRLISGQLRLPEAQAATEDALA